MLKGGCLLHSCGGQQAINPNRGGIAGYRLHNVAFAPALTKVDSTTGGGHGASLQQQLSRLVAARSFPAPAVDAAQESSSSSSSSSRVATSPQVPAPEPHDLSLAPFKSLVEGRSFFCTMCGKCCTGDGEIWVSPDEAAVISRHLNMSLPRFLDTHTKQYSKYRGWRMLKTAEGSSSCIFLAPDNKCAIHSVRPSQCSTYPWWPELTVDSEWEWEKANICEGFDHPEAGPLDVGEAAKQLREANKMTQMRLLASDVRISRQVADWADNVLLWDEDVGGSNEREAAGGGEATPAKQKPQGRAGNRGSNGKGGSGGGSASDGSKKGASRSGGGGGSNKRRASGGSTQGK